MGDDRYSEVITRCLVADAADLGPYEPPAEPIDYVVKVSAFDEAEEQMDGTGFVTWEGGYGCFVITARHVIRRARRVEVVTSQGGCLGGAVSYPAGNADTSDCGIVLIIRSFKPGSTKELGDPPAGVFEARAEGFRANHLDLSSVKLVDAKLSEGLIRHELTSNVYAGLSGGPLLVDDRVVGQHIRAATGLPLLFDQYLNRCVAAAHAALTEILEEP